MTTDASDRHFCAGQLARLSGLKNYAWTPEGKTELMTASLSFRSQQGFEKFVTDWLRSAREAPQPADLYEAAARGHYEPNQKAQIGCERCDWTGWRYVQKGEQEGVEKCGCRNGSNA